MAYDGSDYEREDAEALKRRREALRAFAKGVAEAVQTLQLPETYLEAERATRAVMIADRLIVRVREATLGGDEEAEVRYPSTAEQSDDWTNDMHLSGVKPQQAGAEKRESTPTPYSPMNGEATAEDNACLWNPDTPLARHPLRLRLRVYADRVMEAATFIPKPDNFLDGERAGRYGLSAERMLTQLYEPLKAKPSEAKAPDPGYDDDAEDEYAEDGRKIFRPRSKGLDPSDSRIDWADWQFALEEKLDKLAERRRIRAEATGFWDDGKPYVPSIPYDEPIRYNPDGSILSTRESELRRSALHEALQDAANKAHGWAPPPDPPP